MSSESDTLGATLKERGAAATRDLCAALELGELSPTNVKYLTIAVMEVATESARQDDGFAQRVRSTYDAIVPAKPARGARASREAASRAAHKPWKVKLMPVGDVDEALLDPYAPPNPFALQQLYGNEQLSLALERYSLTKLKEAVAVVQERYPGTRPRRITKPGIIEYIVETLTGAAAPSDR